MTQVTVWENKVQTHNVDHKWWLKSAGGKKSWATDYSRWKKVYDTVSNAWQHQAQHSASTPLARAKLSQIEQYEQLRVKAGSLKNLAKDIGFAAACVEASLRERNQPVVKPIRFRLADIKAATMARLNGEVAQSKAIKKRKAIQRPGVTRPGLQPVQLVQLQPVQVEPVQIEYTVPAQRAPQH